MASRRKIVSVKVPDDFDYSNIEQFVGKSKKIGRKNYKLNGYSLHKNINEPVILKITWEIEN